MPAVNSHRKGKDGELECAKRLRELGFGGAKRDGQQGSGDATEHPDVKGIPGLHVETKRVERFGGSDAYAALGQARRDAARDELPVVIHRPSRKPWICIMFIEDWADVIHKAQAYDAAVASGQIREEVGEDD